MPQYLLALINPGDYDSFRRILDPDCPNTYDEWSDLHVKQLADLLARGETYREIQVNPDEFIRFCASRKATPNYQLLRDFAVKKGSGNSY
jgi:hypothetical protein